jgi:hypothetical protein
MLCRRHFHTLRHSRRAFFQLSRFVFIVFAVSSISSPYDLAFADYIITLNIFEAPRLLMIFGLFRYAAAFLRQPFSAFFAQPSFRH